MKSPFTRGKKGITKLKPIEYNEELLPISIIRPINKKIDVVRIKIKLEKLDDEEFINQG